MPLRSDSGQKLPEPWVTAQTPYQQTPMDTGIQSFARPS